MKLRIRNRHIFVTNGNGRDETEAPKNEQPTKRCTTYKWRKIDQF